MIRYWVCKNCGNEWEEDTDRPRERTPTIFDEAEYCMHCKSYNIAPKMSGVTSTLRYVDTVIELQARMNAIYEAIEPIKNALNEIEEIRAKLQDEFSFLTTDDNWSEIIDSPRFYQITMRDVESLKNTAEKRIEEW